MTALFDSARDERKPGSYFRTNPDYDGKAIVLNAELGIHLSPEEFPKLKSYLGKTLITTDGTTLLGADNKAGIAAIITAVSHLQENPEIPHGDICIGFTPDEEIGRGADHFDVPAFGAISKVCMNIWWCICRLNFDSFRRKKAFVIKYWAVNPPFLS